MHLQNNKAALILVINQVLSDLPVSSRREMRKQLCYFLIIWNIQKANLRMIISIWLSPTCIQNRNVEMVLHSPPAQICGFHSCSIFSWPVYANLHSNQFCFFVDTKEYLRCFKTPYLDTNSL